MELVLLLKQGIEMPVMEKEIRDLDGRPDHTKILFALTEEGLSTNSAGLVICPKHSTVVTIRGTRSEYPITIDDDDVLRHVRDSLIEICKMRGIN